MKVIIAGSRGITEYAEIEYAMHDSGFDATEIVSGGARGVDTLGEQWAKEYNILLTVMKADWEVDGRRAGMLRNISMAKYADALVALWDGNSNGTAHMITEAVKQRLKVFVVTLTRND